MDLVTYHILFACMQKHASTVNTVHLNPLRRYDSSQNRLHVGLSWLEDLQKASQDNANHTNICIGDVKTPTSGQILDSMHPPDTSYITALSISVVFNQLTFASYCQCWNISSSINRSIDNGQFTL
ncbi:hypothetical protein EWB00_003981 [Schistosoma japonicum]|uniref:Uncharacterized protein n=1 Tax=Schistosoma japonicum TaxID=6182 RepID=A0A4Z2D7S2_SCHJA|nr:hypothetical protein EWB00_003981 [Schistosoma japonicum]